MDNMSDKSYNMGNQGNMDNMSDKSYNMGNQGNMDNMSDKSYNMGNQDDRLSHIIWATKVTCWANHVAWVTILICVINQVHVYVNIPVIISALKLSSYSCWFIFANFIGIQN